jgi:HEAT repeat protein
MQFKVLVDKFWFFFALILVSVLGLVVFRTPITIPEGFPYSPIVYDTEKLVKEKKQSPVRFVDKTLEKGLYFIHQQGGDELAGIDESLGAGACTADFDNDGWIDLFLVNGSGHTRYYGRQYWWQTSQGNALFRNTEGRGFKDVTGTSGLNSTIWGMGCVAADFDNDNDADLLVTGKNVKTLYRNNGDGTFTDVSQDAGVDSHYWSTSAVAVDVNRDGLLDIYVGNFIDFEKGKKTFEANSQFALEKKQTFDPSLYPAQPNQLYLNLGALRFKDITAEAKVADSEGRTLDVSALDINRDGLPDFLVSNDRGTGSNIAYLNRDGTQFDEGGQALGLRSALGSRGVASGDLNNDGDIDVAIASSTGESTVALVNEQSAQQIVRYHDQARQNGIGEDQFLSISGWSPIVQDFNNDGFNDLFIGAGQLEPDPDTAKVSLGQSKQLLINSGNGHFIDASAVSGIALQDKQSARGAVAADFDNDGDVDLYVVHNNDLGQYLVNESTQKHWLGLKLIGSESNRDAIGAEVQLITARATQIKAVASGEGFLSDSDKRLIFGLDDEVAVERIVIKWPSGRKQTIRSLKVDQYWEIAENRDEPKTLAEDAGAPDSESGLGLKLGVDQPQIRARYVRMLGQSKDMDIVWSELKAALNDADANVRLEVITLASRLNTAQGLALLVRGLEDAEAANVVAAIEGLRIYEDEAAVRWLLRVFSHNSAAVKIALADCFGYFFQEEEAVVYRKYLAVPHLIRLLDDSAPGVRVAAARALANAERFRGVHALVEHLSDSDPNVRAELVRTLGLIRQAASQPKLNALLVDNTQSPQVLANTLVALKRLGDENAFGKLTAFVTGQAEFASVPSTLRLAVLANLFDSDNHVSVFDAQQIVGVLRATFSKFLSAPKAPDSIRQWLAIWQQVSDPISVDWLMLQTREAEPKLRAAAYLALLNQHPTGYIAILRKAWQDLDPEINRWALTEILTKKVDVNAEDFLKILANPEWRSLAVRIWAEQGVLSEPAALINALQSVALLDSPGVSNSTGLENICFNSKAEWQAFCPLLLFANPVSDHAGVARKLLLDSRLAVDLRQAVLGRYGLAFDADALNTLFTIAQARKDLLRNQAISKLFAIDSDSLVDFARKIADNPVEDTDIRFQAIEFLTRRGDAEAWAGLYRQQSAKREELHESAK